MTKFKPNDRVRVRKNLKLKAEHPHSAFTMKLLREYQERNEILVVKYANGYTVDFYDAKDIKLMNRAPWGCLGRFLTKYKVDQNTYPDFEVKDVDTV